jgi:hypothetical protein
MVIGSGVANAQPSVTVNFGNQTVGTTSAAQTTSVTLDSGYVFGGGDNVTGDNADFVLSPGTCAGAAAGSSCQVSDTFTPTTTGPRSESFDLYECPTPSGTCVDFETVTLNGTGVSPTATAAPTQGASGTVVSITGTLWDPTGGPISVKFAAGSDTGTATVDGSGNLTGSITVGASEIVGSNPIVLTQGSFSLPIPFTVLASSGSGGRTSGHGDCTVTPTAPRSPSSAPGDGSATVSWGPPLQPTQQCVAGDLVTPYLGGVAQTPTLITGPGTTTVIKGLNNGGKYTFKIATENGSVEGPTSVMTTPITIGTPSQPTGLTAVKGRGSATLHWKAPRVTNGKPITGYTIVVFLGSKLVKTVTVGVTTHSTITGLTKGNKYTFTVAAENRRGTGVASKRSNTVAVI